MELNHHTNKNHNSTSSTEWINTKIGNILTIKHGKSQKDIITNDGIYPILATGGEIGRTNTSIYDKPSVLIGRKGTIDVPQFMNTPFWTIDTLFYSEINTNADPKYVYFLLSTINWKLYNEASGVPSLNASTIEKIDILLPPFPEQQAISEALSDVDALIASLEALIAKKRAIKQGVMQELLTGKTRLPGFIGTWIEKPLGDLGKCIRGVSYNPNRDLSSSMTNSTTVLLRANNIVEGIIDYDNIQYVDNNVVSEIQQLLKGDVLIAMSSGSRIAIGKTGTFSKTEGKYCVGAFCAVYRSQQNNFVRYLFQSNLYKRQLMNMLEGTSINNLNSGKIEGLIFAFPPTYHEQNAIAEILLDVDNEINALTSKLDKVTKIKQGMMQELLTGRIRLRGGQQ